VGTVQLLILLLVQCTVAGKSVKTCTMVVTLYCCCLFCTVVVLTCFVMCGCVYVCLCLCINSVLTIV
jgi:hypothetical protein